MSGAAHRNALAAGHLLHWYRIERVLGRGGFGITYLATDTNLDRPVAIKEFLPVELAVRERDASVHPHAEDKEQEYRLGLERFIREAKTLARFEHPAIVRVYSVFEANNTACMVMRYERGQTLQEALQGQRALDPERLLELLLPLLDGLELIHGQGFIHRDIKPANLFLREEGGPLLIDFGSARQALGRETRTLTAMVSPGYAPFEQYHGKAEQQGPWTDLYGLAATAYRALLGNAPVEALVRSEGLLNAGSDPYVPAVEAGTGRFPEPLLAAIDHALAFLPENRPQSVEQWRAELTGEEMATVIAPAGSATRETAAPTAASPPPAPPPAETADSEAPTLAATGAPPPPETADRGEDYRAFIGPRLTERYLERLQELDRHPSRWRPQWNLSAALGGPFWLAWRRLYGALLLHPLISAALGLLLLLPVVVLAGGRPLPPGLIATAIVAAAFLWPGLWGSRLLHRKARKAIAQADERALEGEARREWLTRRGGTSRRALALTLLAALALLLLPQPGGPPPASPRPAAKEPAGEIPAAPTPAPEPARTEPRPAPPPDDPVPALLRGAREDIAALRLTSPRGNNAMEKVRRVLERDPGNTEAARLQEQVARKYAELAATAYEREDLARARDYLDRALELAPGLPELEEYRQELKAAQLVAGAQEAANRGRLDEALSLLRQAHRLAPENREIESWLRQLQARRLIRQASAAITAGNRQEAVRLLKEARRRYGNSKEIREFEKLLRRKWKRH